MQKAGFLITRLILFAHTKCDDSSETAINKSATLERSVINIGQAPNGGLNQFQCAKLALVYFPAISQKIVV